MFIQEIFKSCSADESDGTKSLSDNEAQCSSLLNPAEDHKIVDSHKNNCDLKNYVTAISLKWFENFKKFLKPSKKHLKYPLLEEPTVESIVKYIKSGNCKNIITMAGAGISTSAGIPDFRSPDSGIYSTLQNYDLPYPEAIFDIQFFRSNPEPFFTLAKELYPKNFSPTISHYFIKLLHEKGILLRHYTQNIDALEHKAGIPSEKIVEAHGTVKTSHCLSCNIEYDQKWIEGEIFANKIPTCTKCSGVVKPDIVFFREALPERFFKLASQDFNKCDLLIIMGTSLTVQPFASLVDDVSQICPRLLLNRENVGVSDPLMSAFLDMMSPLSGSGLFGERGGLRINVSGNTRDVGMIGDCDEQCRILARKLGWEEDLENLIKLAEMNSEK